MLRIRWTYKIDGENHIIADYLALGDRHTLYPAALELPSIYFLGGTNRQEFMLGPCEFTLKVEEVPDPRDSCSMEGCEKRGGVCDCNGRKCPWDRAAELGVI